LAEIQATSKVIRLKDRFEKPVNGYRDVLMNVETSNGHIVEMQLHLESILKVKDGMGHALYEQERSILAEIASAGRPPTAAENARLAEIRKKAKALYDDAYAEAGKGQ